MGLGWFLSEEEKAGRPLTKINKTGEKDLAGYRWPCAGSPGHHLAQVSYIHWPTVDDFLLVESVL